MFRFRVERKGGEGGAHLLWRWKRAVSAESNPTMAEGLEAADLAADIWSRWSRRAGDYDDSLRAGRGWRTSVQGDGGAGRGGPRGNVANRLARCFFLISSPEAGMVLSRRPAWWQTPGSGHLEAGGGGDGDEDVADGVPEAMAGRSETAPRTGQLDAACLPSGFSSMNRGHRRRGGGWSGSRGEHIAGLAGTVDDHALAWYRLGAQGVVAERCGRRCGCRRCIGAEEEVQDVDGAGESPGREGEEDGGRRNRRRRGWRGRREPDRHGDVAHQPRSSFEEAEDGGLDEDPDGDGPGHLGEEGAFDLELEADQEGEEAAEGEDGDLGGPDQEARGAAGMEAAGEVVEGTGEHGLGPRIHWAIMDCRRTGVEMSLDAARRECVRHRKLAGRLAACGGMGRLEEFAEWPRVRRDAGRCAGGVLHIGGRKIAGWKPAAG